MMTDPNPTTPRPEPGKHNIAIKVIGVGGAGGCVASQLAHEALEGMTFAAVDTDAVALAKCLVSEKIQLGTKPTRGWFGGDPDLARTMAEEPAPRIRALCEGMDLVFVVAGLGGGAGAGAGPVVARVAREAGALVLAFVTSPFDWEASRRQSQAQMGLQQLKTVTDGVICLPNQKLLKLIDVKTSLVETFKLTNELLTQVVRCIWRLFVRPGFIHINFADLCALLNGAASEIYFATAQASGENRAREVVEKLLADPGLAGGQVLSDAQAVLVSIQGARDLTLAEIHRVMEQINRQCEHANVMMDAAVEETAESRLSVTLLASQGKDPNEKTSLILAQPGESSGEPASRRPGVPVECDTQFHTTPSARPPFRYAPPAPALTPERAKQLLARQSGLSSRAKRISAKIVQGQLPLEIVSKGRFDKSEPTIHHGEDLDVPTYIRRGVPLN